MPFNSFTQQIFTEPPHYPGDLPAVQSNQLVPTENRFEREDSKNVDSMSLCREGGHCYEEQIRGGAGGCRECQDLVWSWRRGVGHVVMEKTCGEERGAVRPPRALPFLYFITFDVTHAAVPSEQKLTLGKRKSDFPTVTKYIMKWI